MPLDTIIAASRLLSRELAEPLVAGVTSEIIGEAENLKNSLYRSLEHHRREKPALPEAVGTIQALEPDTLPGGNLPGLTAPAQGRILMFQKKGENSRSLRLILRAEGFLVTSLDDPYEVLSSLDKEEADVLLVDPVSSGEAALSLCSLIRTTKNILQLKESS